MEDHLRKTRLQYLLNTLQESDKGKKVEICNILKGMVKEEMEEAERHQSDILYLRNKLHTLIEKTIENNSK